MSVFPNVRVLDRILGICITIGCGIGIILLRNYWTRISNKKKSDQNEEGDSVYKTRYSPNQSKKDMTIHNGTCHCKRVKFRIKAGRSLQAVDVSSKLRYPRISVPVTHFESQCDESILSLYAVQSVEEGLGVHTFCSFCGMQILFSPSVDPSEVQVNTECLHQDSIENINVSYLSITDTVPVPVSYEHAKPYNRQGAGSMFTPRVIIDPNQPSLGSGHGVINNVFPKNTPVHPTELGLVEYIGDKGTHENIYTSPHKGSYSSLYGHPQNPNSQQRMIRENNDAYNYLLSPNSAQNALYGHPLQNPFHPSTSMRSMFSELQRTWSSPSEKYKKKTPSSFRDGHMKSNDDGEREDGNWQQVMSNNACDAYLDTYYGVASLEHVDRLGNASNHCNYSPLKHVSDKQDSHPFKGNLTGTGKDMDPSLYSKSVLSDANNIVRDNMSFTENPMGTYHNGTSSSSNYTGDNFTSSASAAANTFSQLSNLISTSGSVPYRSTYPDHTHKRTSLSGGLTPIQKQLHSMKQHLSHHLDAGLLSTSDSESSSAYNYTSSSHEKSPQGYTYNGKHNLAVNDGSQSSSNSGNTQQDSYQSNTSSSDSDASLSSFGGFLNSPLESDNTLERQDSPAQISLATDSNMSSIDSNKSHIQDTYHEHSDDTKHIKHFPFKKEGANIYLNDSSQDKENVSMNVSNESVSTNKGGVFEDINRQDDDNDSDGIEGDATTIHRSVVSV